MFGIEKEFLGDTDDEKFEPTYFFSVLKQGIQKFWE